MLSKYRSFLSAFTNVAKVLLSELVGIAQTLRQNT